MMSDVEKDVELVKHMSGSDKLRIASNLDDFMIKVFKERIRREHPRAGAKKVLEILRKELSHGRRDIV